jgi:hypothetical protein
MWFALREVMEALAPWLFVGVVVSAVLHALLPPRFIADQLRGVAGIFKAVAFGVPLPLCSCGVIPAGVGLKKDGASDGSAIGFLISTPQTGVDSVLVAAGFLGWPFALFKVVTAGVLGVVGGLLAHRWGEPAASASPGSHELSRGAPGWREGFWHGVQVLRSIWWWLLVGVVASAFITVWAPAQELGALGRQAPAVVYAAVLALSIPLYVCATASVPIAAALVAAGLPAGSALVFLIAGPATNVATIGAVARTFGRRLLVVYLATLVLGSLVLGIAFDQLLPPMEVVSQAHHHHAAWWETALALLLVASFVAFAVEELKSKWTGQSASSGAGWVVPVTGMTCGGCASKLERTLRSAAGVEGVDVDLAGAQAHVYGAISAALAREAVARAGFEPGDPEPL